jgi:hypothetical protein
MSTLHAPPNVPQVAVRYLVAVFYHWRNSRAAEDLCARIALEKDPNGNSQIPTRADGGRFDGLGDVDHGSKAICVDVALRRQAQRIVETHREAGLTFEVHYVQADADGSFQFVPDPATAAPAQPAAASADASAPTGQDPTTSAAAAAPAAAQEPSHESPQPAHADPVAEAAPGAAASQAPGTGGERGSQRTGRRAHTGSADGVPRS